MNAIDFVHQNSKKLMINDKKFDSFGKCCCCGNNDNIDIKTFACEGCYFLFQTFNGTCRFGSIGASIVMSEKSIEVFLKEKDTIDFSDKSIKVNSVQKHSLAFLKRITNFGNDPFVAFIPKKARASFDALWINVDPTYVKISINPFEYGKSSVWEYNAKIVRDLLSCGITKSEVILMKNLIHSERFGLAENKKDDRIILEQKLETIGMKRPTSDRFLNELNICAMLTEN